MKRKEMMEDGKIVYLLDQSWLETYSELLECYVRALERGKSMPVLQDAQKGGGLFAVHEELQGWADEFEEKNEDTDWSEREFIDDVWDFFGEKIEGK